MSCSRKIHGFRTDRRLEVKNGESILHTDNQVILGTVPPGGTTNQVLTKCSNRDFHTHWEDITNLIGPIIIPPFSLTLGNMVFVSTTGDDTTGQPNRLDLPYATIRTAVNSAPAGSLVYVYTGTYTESVTGSDFFTQNVNLYLEQGTVYNVEVINGYLFNTALGSSDNVIHGPEATLNVASNNPINAEDSLLITIGTFTSESFGFRVGPNNERFKFEAREVTVQNDLLQVIGAPRDPDWDLRNNCTLYPIYVKVDKLTQTGGDLTNFLFNFTYVSRPVILELGHVCLGKIHRQASYFMMRKNVCSMNIKIKSIIRNKNYPGYSSIFGTDSCLAIKNIEVDWLFTTGLIWNAYEIQLTSYISNNYPESGSINIKGLVDVNVNRNPLFHANYDGYFDFRQPESRLRFNLDLINLAMNIDITSTMNISTPHNRCKIIVSGRIESASTNNATASGVLTMGMFDGRGHDSPSASTLALSTVVLRDLAIVVYDTTTSFSVYKNSGLSIAELPVINTHSTINVDASITQTISTIVINSFTA